MRISDWSSDVCSSDLSLGHYTAAWLFAGRKRFPGGQQQLCVDVGSDDKAVRRAVVPAILRCAARDGAARRVGEDRYRKPGDAALFLLSRGAELLALIERTVVLDARDAQAGHAGDRKSTRLNSSH